MGPRPVGGAGIDGDQTIGPRPRRLFQLWHSHGKIPPIRPSWLVLLEFRFALLMLEGSRLPTGTDPFSASPLARRPSWKLQPP
jgi:hypothetical protein